MTIIAPLADNRRVTAVDLRAAMQNKAFQSADEGRGTNVSLNGTYDDLPTVVARCETRQDVQLAIRTAKTHGLTIAERGSEGDRDGGLGDGGAMIVDLAAMRRVTVEPATKVAIVGGGATVDDVVSAAAAHGLTPVTGPCGSVRLADVTLGGGYGPLLGRYGLAADNLIEAEIVLKNGQHVIANADRNADLFWALRGSARDFGVTTSLRVRLYALPALLSGMIFYAWSDAELVLRGYSEIMASAPDCLTVSVGIVSKPDGNPLLFVNPTWCGDPDEGARVLATLQAFGTPVAAQLGPMSCRELIAMYDGLVVGDSNFSKRVRRLLKLDGRVISAMIVAAKAGTSPLSAIMLHHFHGAPTRVRPEATGFNMRQEHFVLEAIAAWHPSANDNGAGHRLWAQNLSDSARPPAPLGDYGNHVRPDRRVVTSMRDGNKDRLSEVKQAFDPDCAGAAALPAFWTGARA
jgi:FAD binding domain